jgi:ABC-type sulfate/molybdate transport systems ATPase subunit
MCSRSANIMLDAEIIKKRREFTIHVSLKLDEGQSLGLFGASGAGKSTILACIAGIEDPDEGQIEFDSVKFFPPSLPVHQRSVGYLTQEPALFPHLTVGENIWFGIPKSHATKYFDWVMILRETLQLATLWKAPASLVSGGQARRVALARMLARRPRLVLLDEPFAGLDRQFVRETIDHLLAWSRTIGFSMIAVDHQAEVLKRLCPYRAIVIEDGRVVQSGTWAEFCSTPATPLLRSLLAPL